MLLQMMTICRYKLQPFNHASIKQYDPPTINTQQSATIQVSGTPAIPPAILSTINN